MGLLFSRLLGRLLGSSQEFKILILGLANAGKTTLLYQLNLGQCINTQPTIGCNIEEVRLKNVRLQAWDIGGQESLRSVWPSYFQNSHGVIYVVDSSETRQDYLHQSKLELHRLLEHQDLRGVALLVLANKNDLQGLSAQEISSLLALHSITSHSYHIQSCSAKDNQGLQSGLDWLVHNMLAQKGG